MMAWFGFDPNSITIWVIASCIKPNAQTEPANLLLGNRTTINDALNFRKDNLRTLAYYKSLILALDR